MHMRWRYSAGLYHFKTAMTAEFETNTEHINLLGSCTIPDDNTTRPNGQSLVFVLRASGPGTSGAVHFKLYRSEACLTAFGYLRV